MQPASCQHVTIDVCVMCFPPLQPSNQVMSSKILNSPQKDQDNMHIILFEDGMT